MNKESGSESLTASRLIRENIIERPEYLSKELSNLRDDGPQLLTFLFNLAQAIDDIEGENDTEEHHYWEPLVATGFCSSLLDITSNKNFYRFESGFELSEDGEINSYAPVRDYSADIE